MLNLNLATFISRIITLLIALTFHELSHAWTANAFGDDTPRMNGRLTLNPLAHLDPMGSLMLVLVGFGWAKPVPINPYALRRRSKSAVMWVSLAGPMSNFLLAILAAIPLRFGWVTFQGTSNLIPTAYSFLIEFMSINLLLMIFNLIPIAPLDGEKIIEYLSPASWGTTLDKIRPYGPLILLFLVFIGPRVGLDVFAWIIRPVFTGLRTLLLGG